MMRIKLLDPAYEDIRHAQGEELFRKSARNTFRMLWQDWDFDLNQLRGLNLLKVLFSHRSPLTVFLSTIFVKRNPQFLYVVREELRLILARLANSLAELDLRSLDQEELQKIEFGIHNLLSIYVMFEPHPSETITIPQLITDIEGGRHWLTSKFNTTPIELTPSQPHWKRVLSDSSRIFSYGFSPITNTDEANSLLVHSGTTWPTAQGSFLQIVADMWPNKTPGEVFFDWRFAELKSWVDAQKNNITTCGQSLGGSLSILSALAFPEKIKNVFPLSPTALVKDYKNHPIFGSWFKCAPNARPTPKIQAHPGDFVFYVGQVPEEGFEVYGLKPSGKNQEFKDFGPLAAHMRSYATNTETKLKKYDIVRENNKKERRLFNDYLTTYGRWFAHLLNLSTLFVLNPIKRFFANNKLRTALFVAGVLTVLLFPPAGAFILSLSFIPHFTSLLATSLLPVFLSATLISKSYEFFQGPLKHLKNSTLTEALLHALSFGLYSDVKASFIKIKNALSQTDVPYPEAEIHSNPYLEKAKNIEASEPPSLLFKIGLASLAAVSALISAPFLLTCYVVKKVFWDLPRNLFNCCQKRSESIGESLEFTEQDHDHSQQNRKPQNSQSSQSSFALFRDFVFPKRNCQTTVPTSLKPTSSPSTKSP